MAEISGMYFSIGTAKLTSTPQVTGLERDDRVAVTTQREALAEVAAIPRVGYKETKPIPKGSHNFGGIFPKRDFVAQITLIHLRGDAKYFSRAGYLSPDIPLAEPDALRISIKLAFWLPSFCAEPK